MTIAVDELNLRHLRAFVEVCRMGSISAASDVVHLSQPAVTHALRKLEDQLRAKLFQRSGRGMEPTQLGEQMKFRVERALVHLNAGVQGPRSQRPDRLESHATAAQLRTLDAIGRTRSFSAAARSLGVAQPTAYRAARDLEAGLKLPLFEKSPSGILLTRQGLTLQRAARLMNAELDQALQEVAAAIGQGAPETRIGALPLARATVLAQAVDRMLTLGQQMRFHVDEGPFAELLQAVRSGDLDILVGALRTPPPAPDVTQEVLFSDRLSIFCGPGHPILSGGKPIAERLGKYPWVLPRRETPTRSYFEATFPEVASAIAGSLIETSSMILVRELLQSGRRLTLMSRAQVTSEIRQGLIFELPIALNDLPRPIGLLYRSDWFPTAEQEAFLNRLREVSAETQESVL